MSGSLTRKRCLIPRCRSALAQRRHQKLELTHPITGKRYRVETPKNTFPPERLVRAMESVQSGRDPEAVTQLVQPFKDRPEVLNSIFKVMFVIGGMSREPISQ